MPLWLALMLAGAVIAFVVSYPLGALIILVGLFVLIAPYFRQSPPPPPPR